MDTWILNCTTAGQGQIGSGETAFLVKKGDLLLFPPEVIHDYSADPQIGTWTHLWVYFFPRESWLPLLNWPKTETGILQLSINQAVAWQQLVKRFEELIELSRSPLPRRDDFTMNALEEILLKCDLLNPMSESSILDSRIENAVNYLCKNYNRSVSLQELAKKCGLSESRLWHLFRDSLGVSPLHYHEEQRIGRARELLTMTNKTVSKIATELGFDSVFYFSRLFKKNTGQSPTSFRQAAVKG